jgi:hypothetical protein
MQTCRAREINRCDRNSESGRLSGRRDRDFEACRPAHTAPADCSHQNGKATPTTLVGLGFEADQYANGLH